MIIYESKINVNIYLFSMGRFDFIQIEEKKSKKKIIRPINTHTYIYIYI